MAVARAGHGAEGRRCRRRLPLYHCRRRVCPFPWSLPPRTSGIAILAWWRQVRPRAALSYAGECCLVEAAGRREAACQWCTGLAGVEGASLALRRHEGRKQAAQQIPIAEERGGRPPAMSTFHRACCAHKSQRLHCVI
jgi:hypothetical protein